MRSGSSSSVHSRHPGSFPETQWSIIVGLASETPDRRKALSRLCGSYFYPVFAFLKQSGSSDADAYAYAQGFFEQVLAGVHERPEDMSFRVFLLTRLADFAGVPVRGNIDLPGVPDDYQALADRFRGEADRSDSPEGAFERRFAQEVVVRALRKLRTEAEANQRVELFDGLIEYLTRDPTAEERGDLSRRFGMSGLALTIALKRLRARYAELSNRELSNTVVDPGALAEERLTIHNILGASDD